MKLTQDLNTASLTLLASVVGLALALETPKTQTFQRPLRLAVGSLAFCTTTKFIQDFDKDVREVEQIKADDVVRSAVIDTETRCRIAYYKLHPEKYRQGKPVPDEWRQAFVMTIPETVEATTNEPVQSAAAFNGSSNPFGDYKTSVFDEIQTNPDAFWKPLLNPSALLIYGGDGSGKTTFSKGLIEKRIKQESHEVIALDPHGSPNSWSGCRVVGQGLDFAAIEREIDKVMSLVKQRYEMIANGQALPNSFPHLTVVCEEMTDWSASVKNSHLLITKMGDYRKVNIHLLMIAHGNSMGQIAAPRGSNEIIQNCLMQLRLFSKPGETGSPIPAFKGTLKHPGTVELIDVAIPQVTLTNTQTNYAATQPIKQSERPETPLNAPTTHETPKVNQTPVKVIESGTGSNTDNLTIEEELLQKVRFYQLANKPDDFIILNIWGVTESEGIKYKAAKDFLNNLKQLLE